MHSSETEPSPLPIARLSLCVILPDKGTRTAAVDRLKAAFDGVDLFQAKSRKTTTPVALKALLTLENSVLRYPGEMGDLAGIPRLPDELRNYDVILDLSTDQPDTALAAKTKYGVWFLGPFDSDAVLRGDPNVTLRLLRICPDAGEARSVAQMKVQTKFQLSRTQAFATEKALQLVRHELARLSVCGAVSDDGPAPPPPASARTRHMPGHLWRLAREMGRRIAVRGRTGPEREPTFSLRVGQGDVETFDPATGEDVVFERKGYRADPFLWHHDGALYCFFEDFPAGSAQAHISAARWSEDGFEECGAVLKTAHHLSYPFVFGHGGDVFMMPETIGAARVEIWRATAFPMQWALHATALDGHRLADPVLLEHNGAWWLFGSPSHDSIGDFSSELWVYQVDGPAMREVTPHPLNPVVVGSDAARGGGRIVSSNGRLFRMSQDNSGGGYGYGLNVMEITELSATTYRERRLRHLTPETIPGAIGLHHADFFDGRYVADVRWPG